MKVFVILALFFASTLASDCVGTWGAWGACTGACGAQGSQTRYYTVQTPATDYGKECPFADYASQVQPCAVACPANDCVGAWDVPTPCVSNGVCGSDAGKQTRTYKVSKPQGPGGAACPTPAGTVQELACSAPVVPCVACAGSYGPWGTCTSKGVCGSDAGSQSRTYAITTPAGPGGLACPFANGHEEKRDCAAPVTPCVNCVGSFGPPSPCVSKGVCGSSAGTQTTTYKIEQQAGPGGYACSHTDGFQQAQACEAPITPCVDCAGSWSEYTTCESLGRCGSSAGRRSRTFKVTQAAGPGGKPCEAADNFVEVTACAAAVTPCKGCVGSWSAYTDCKSDGVCGSDSGKHSRTYTITEPGEPGGALCEAANGHVEESRCSATVTPCAAVDCEGRFGALSTCKAVSCGTTEGKQSHTFSITKAAAYGGKACEYANGFVESVACEAVNTPCPVGCVGAWGEPSACVSNGVCGSDAGTLTYTYSISVPAAYGGAACPKRDGATRKEACKAPITPCPPENGVGSWSPWSACKARGCGTSAGDRTSTYTVAKEARYGGTPCEASNGAVRTEQCEVAVTPCPVPCIGAFSSFSECKSKGECSSPAGTKSRTFTITQPAAFGGAECAHKNGDVDTEDCNNAPVTPCPPVPCVGKWVPAPCTQTQCGASAGTSAETFAVTQAAKYEGTPCEAQNGDKRSVPCTVEKVTPCPINCVGTYSGWTTCKADAPCGSTRGTQERKFTVTTQAQFGGVVCPATDGQVESRDCEATLVKCPPVDCVGTFSELTPCKQLKCDSPAGVSSQTYSISVRAAHEGKECPFAHGSVHTSECTIPADKVTRCPIDCTGEFDAPTECKPVEECGCAKGTQTRTYKITTKAQFGGKQCNLLDGEKVTATCAVTKVKPCPDPVLDAPCDDLKVLVRETKAVRCQAEAIVAALEKK